MVYKPNRSREIFSIESWYKDLITISFDHHIEKIRTNLLLDERLDSYLQKLANHDRDTYLHTLRVCSLSLDLGLENGLEPQLLSYLGYASLLHDIGKTLVPRNLLTKASRLNTLEQRIMQEHVRLGFLTLEDFKPDVVRQISVGHHEFSRSPYPRNGSDRRHASQRILDRRRDTPPEVVKAAQILAVADMFDALAHSRAYKGAYQKEDTEAALRYEFTGDPKLIEQVLKRMDGS